MRDSLWRSKVRLFYWKHYLLTGEPELRLLSRLVDRRRLAIDIGGNTGVYTYHLSRFARDVLTFEPNPEYAALLRAAGLRTRVEAVALSSEPGEGFLRFPSFEGMEHGGMASLASKAVPDRVLSREIAVPLRRLDEYLLDDVGFIKIDVEGHEEAVLAGAEETIDRCRPAMLVEIEERSNPGGLARIAQRLVRWGYDCSFLHAGRRLPLAEFDPSKHQAWLDEVRKRSRLSRVKYINNFIFVSPGR